MLTKIATEISDKAGLQKQILCRVMVSVPFWMGRDVTGMQSLGVGCYPCPSAGEPTAYGVIKT